jgi:hypothetical protein
MLREAYRDRQQKRALSVAKRGIDDWWDDFTDDIKCIGARPATGFCSADGSGMSDDDLRDYYKGVTKVTLECGASAWVGFKTGGPTPQTRMVAAGATSGLCLFGKFIDLW